MLELFTNIGSLLFAFFAFYTLCRATAAAAAAALILDTLLLFGKHAHNAALLSFPGSDGGGRVQRFKFLHLELSQTTLVIHEADLAKHLALLPAHVMGAAD